jgi:hypothetical protein
VPFARIASSSLLSTVAGWVRANKLTANTKIAGVDRHGQISWREVVIGHSHVVEDRIVICSSGAVGEFASSTALLIADGSPISAKEMVDGIDEGAIRFESTTHHLKQITAESWINILAELQSKSPLVGPKHFTLRCQSGSGIPEFEKVGATGTQIININSQFFAIFNSTKLAKYNSHIFCALLELLFSSDDVPGLLEFQVNDDLLINTYVSLSTKSVSLECESLQHTAVVRLRAQPETMGPYTPLRTCFRAARQSETYECQWTELSWKPVVSGFLLAPSQ